MKVSSKSIWLTALSLSLLAVFFLLPRNRQWAQQVIGYWSELPSQTARMSVEERLEDRFKTHYTLSREIAVKLREHGDTGLLMVPPTSYFKLRGINYHVPEPAVFYYFTGVKTVWANSKEAIRAPWRVEVKRGRIEVQPSGDTAAFRDSLDAYIKMGVSL